MGHRKPRYTISISQERKNSIYATMPDIESRTGASFRGIGDYVTQATELLWAQTMHRMGAIKAYNQYVFVATCPLCDRHTMIKLKKSQLVLMIACGCGESFVVQRK